MLYFWHSVANNLLTLISNMVTDLNLTDRETCYKVITRPIVSRLDLQSKRFASSRRSRARSAARARVYEVPISYNGRTYAEGKKIG